MTRLAGTDRDQGATAADQVDEVHESDARADWELRINRKTTDTTGAARRMELPAPTGVRAVGAGGHIRLSWNRVPGAVGYLIERTDGQNGPSGILDHGGSDVPAVSTDKFADTGVRDDVEYSDRIGTVAGAGYPARAWSAPVSARTLDGPAGLVEVRVDASGA